VRYLLKMSSVLILIMNISPIYSQDLHHQMISAQGKSLVIANGMMVSQSIGQQSAIGNFKNGYVVGQGFQQSNWGKFVKKNVETTISTVTYPNPFTTAVNFQFSIPIKNKIQIEVYDIRGRLVFIEEKSAFETLLTINLPQLPSSNYLVRLTAPNYSYYSQILKL
jgi:hypothetical protein